MGRDDIYIWIPENQNGMSKFPENVFSCEYFSVGKYDSTILINVNLEIKVLETIVLQYYLNVYLYI